MKQDGRRNYSGKRITCSNCGYTWFYSGNSTVTSCPKCHYRVKVGATSQTRSLISNPERRNEPLI